MRLVAALFAVAVLAPVPLAAGAEPGVTYDPDSPAGKEYALPINSARTDAGGRASDTAGSGEAPLFGVGIRPAASASASRPSAGSGRASNSSRPGKKRAGSGEGSVTSPRAPSTRSPLRALSAGSQASGTSLLKTGGLLAGLVAAVALALGFAFRTTRRTA
jgi:hypothetical protein